MDADKEGVGGGGGGSCNLRERSPGENPPNVLKYNESAEELTPWTPARFAESQGPSQHPFLHTRPDCTVDMLDRAWFDLLDLLFDRPHSWKWGPPARRPFLVFLWLLWLWLWFQTGKGGRDGNDDERSPHQMTDYPPIDASNIFCLTKPESTTWTTPSMVTLVAAILVAKTTLR